MVSLSDFDYTLPSDRIAQTPVTPRDSSQLLIVERSTGLLQDARFRDLASLLSPNDVLVLNDTKVIPARLLMFNANGKPVEVLLEKEVRVTSQTVTWEVLTKPGLKAGDIVHIPQSDLQGVCTKILGYTRALQFTVSREHFLSQLDTWAKTPIPPYIHWDSNDEEVLRERYQTVYAKYQGAVAAPTAGLHFTPELLDTIRQKGALITTVTLHVGAGTFLPVKSENITEHTMHSERFSLSSRTARQLNQAKHEGKRIIAVGTTAVRVLESASQHREGYLQAQTGETSIYIYPPYQFRFVDSMITNFHTPKSTLLMLVSAFASSPNTPFKYRTFSDSCIGQAYRHALEHDYRFYSFGDAMWIV